jgi:D-glycero-alpha-D-manno-heptose 1-phosphate guanylyltransferase
VSIIDMAAHPKRTTFADITVALLVGGQGTRLRSLINDRPKAMAPVNGRPFLYYLLERLVLFGASNVILCTGFKGHQIREYFAGKHGPLQLYYSQEPYPMGTGGALRYSHELIPTDDVMVMNGDSICSANLWDFRTWHDSRRFAASILLSYRSRTDRYGKVEVNDNECVVHFHEKEECNNSGYVNAGVYLMKRSAIEHIPVGIEVSMEYQILPNLIPQGLGGYQTKSAFLDIGTPDSYERASEFIDFNIHGIDEGNET